MKAATETKRQKALRKICERWGIKIKPNGPWNSGAEEDIAPFFTDPPETKLDEFRWVAVTAGNIGDGSIYYAIPCVTQTGAMDRATEFIMDDIYPEHPVAIYDLDTGKKYKAVNPQCDWEETEEEE